LVNKLGFDKYSADELDIITSSFTVNEEFLKLYSQLDVKGM